jgi:hypothetical protein
VLHSALHDGVEFECVCCGAGVEFLLGDNGYNDEVYFCAECEDRADETLGVDFDYDELGLGG